MTYGWSMPRDDESQPWQDGAGMVRPARRAAPRAGQRNAGAAQRRTLVTPFRGKGAKGMVRPARRAAPRAGQRNSGAAQRRTLVTPFRGKGVGGMVQ